MKAGRLSRAEKSALKWRERVPIIPEGLEGQALALWPDLDATPTRKALTEILRGTKKSADVRLQIISALRRFSEGRSEPLFAIAAIYVSVIALSAALISGTEGVARYILTALLVVSGFVVFHLVAEFAARVEERRKQSFVWLRALEDELFKK